MEHVPLSLPHAHESPAAVQAAESPAAAQYSLHALPVPGLPSEEHCPNWESHAQPEARHVEADMLASQQGSAPVMTHLELSLSQEQPVAAAHGVPPFSGRVEHHSVHVERVSVHVDGACHVH